MHDITILVVNSDAANRKLFEVILRRAGYQVVTVENAEQALSLLSSLRPHLIVSTLHLPGIDGLTFLQRLKDAPATAHIPFVATTAYDFLYSRQHILDAGADDYLVLPTDTGLLLQHVNDIIHRRYKILFQAPL